jgi:adenylosuccinate synthase
MLLLLSGPVAVGKSGVSSRLVAAHGFQIMRTGRYLVNLAEQRQLGTSRKDLQELGDALDLETDYRWVIDASADALAGKVDKQKWIFDSVRKIRQVHHFRGHYGKSVLHVHLIANDLTLKRRYEHWVQSGGEYMGNTPYEVAIQHPNEVATRQLIGIADLIVRTEDKTPEEISENISQTIRQRKNEE